MAKELIITVNGRGKTKVEVDGMKGKDCLKEAEPYIKKLSAGKGTTTTLKPEYGMVATAADRVKA